MALNPNWVLLVRITNVLLQSDALKTEIVPRKTIQELLQRAQVYDSDFGHKLHP